MEIPIETLMAHEHETLDTNISYFCQLQGLAACLHAENVPDLK